MPDLTVWRYDSPFGAGAGEVRLKRLEQQGGLALHDAITVSWLPGTHQPRIGRVHHATASAAGRGSVLGALAGLLVLAPAAGAAAGAGIGALAQRLHNTGIDQQFLETIVASLQPGTSALLVLAGDVDVDLVRPVVEHGRARGDVVLMHAQLSDEAPAALRRAMIELGLPNGAEPLEP